MEFGASMIDFDWGGDGVKWTHCIPIRQPNSRLTPHFSGPFLKPAAKEGLNKSILS